MIVQPWTEDRQLVVTQNDHAALAAEILSLWRTDGLPEHPRRRELLYAVREHDNGWREADSAPRRRGDGHLHDFLSVPGEWRREIWRRGARRHLEKEPYAALLILRHALELHRSLSSEPAWADLFVEWRSLEEELLERVGVEPEDLEEDYQWLALCDSLSLGVCAGWRGTQEMDGVHFVARADGDRLELFVDPFPLAGATTLELAGRLLRRRPHESDTALAMALATARWQRLPVRIAPMELRPEE